MKNSPKKATLLVIVSLICSPIFSMFLYLKLNYYLVKCKMNPEDKNLIQKWEKMKWEISQFIKLELGLETVYQVAGQLVLLFMALTKTATEKGFTTIFQKGPTSFQEGEDNLTRDIFSKVSENIGIDNHYRAIFLLVLSILLSFKSCITTHLKLLVAKRERFPMGSKIMAASYSFFCCTTRIMIIIMYFAPALGLFNLLHHWQAEQTPWEPNIEGYFVTNGTIELKNHTIVWNQIDRWSKRNNESIFIEVTNVQGTETNTSNIEYLADNPEPSYTLYTFFTLGQYFIGFCIIMSLHMVFVYLAKWKYCHDNFQQLNHFEKIIHAIENLNIPFNIEEWDSGNGNAQAHRLRMEANATEIKSLLVVNFLFNSLMLSPLCILGIYI